MTRDPERNESAERFSDLAEKYARFRPGYPDALYDYLAEVSPDRSLAWDCATGNGQAALALADRFERVIATDASGEQLALAPRRANIDYRAEPAEFTAIAPGSVALVTAATAIHWFKHEAFYAEVRRVCRPGAVLAAWSYHMFQADPAVDAIVWEYYLRLVPDYFPPGFHHLHKRYANLPFPFGEIEAPAFETRAEWELGHLLGFIASWSGTAKYAEVTGTDPVEELHDRLVGPWGGEDAVRTVVWPLHMRIGHVD